MVNLIMPMGGGGTRFFNNGYMTPKPLIEIQGRPFFYWATQSINKYVDLQSLTFVVLQEHVDQFKIDKTIRAYYPEAQIRVLTHVLNGAVLTCLEGIKSIQDGPVVFNDCDHIFSCRYFYDFCNAGDFSDIDGALLTFRSQDPKFSYLAYDDKGNVLQTVEKEVIGNDAICGAYFFKNKEVFIRSAIQYLEYCSYNEYYVSGVYNVLAAQGGVIRSYMTDWHIPFGTPEEYEAAKESEAFMELID